MDSTVVLKIFNGDCGYHLLSREIMSWKVPLKERKVLYVTQKASKRKKNRKQTLCKQQKYSK